MAGWLAALGGFCWRYAWAVILLWIAAAGLAASTAPLLSERLLSGSGDIAESASLRVDEILRSEFRGTDAQTLILTFRPAPDHPAPGDLLGLVDSLTEELGEQPVIDAVINERDLDDPRLAPKAGSGHFILIELRTPDALATEQEVPRLREQIAPLFEAARARYGPLEWALTGRAALTYDINLFNVEDSTQAELRALPFTLIVLILAFGSLISSAVPLLLAILTRTVALGIVFLVAGSFEVSNLVMSVVTMLALALGIDYSLFLVHRYRRERARLVAEAPDDGAIDETAVRCAMAQSGAAVLYSAVTVAIGMGALLVTPLMETRSIGLGGGLAVLMALLTSLTLVPAFLRVLGPRLLEWPAGLSGRMNGEWSRRMWNRWAALIMRRPVTAILLSTFLLLALAAPALHTRFGFPESEFLPKEIEYTKGVDMLSGMELEGLATPVLVIVTDTNNEAALSPERLPQLGRFVERLEQDPRVRVVLGPVEADQAAPVDAAAPSPASLETAVSGSLYRNAFISDERTRLLFRVIPVENSTFEDLRTLGHSIPALLQTEGLVAEVGGQAQYFDDVDREVGASYPLTIALVLGFSALALLIIFKAPLAAAKALVLNLLSVAAGYGVVVLVFQLGYGAEFFGLAAGTQVVPITVPLVIFCILFGLSMDYEIFLLTRVRTIFLRTRDTQASIRDALADTGSVITSAALIMVVVFGAFAFARVFIVQMIGLGLAVAVLVDATLIRSVLGPALMQVAGRWNWWPLRPGPPQADPCDGEGMEPDRS